MTFGLLLLHGHGDTLNMMQKIRKDKNIFPFKLHEQKKKKTSSLHAQLRLSLRWCDEDRMIRVETEEMSLNWLITLAISPGWTWPTLTGSSWTDKQADKLPQPECVCLFVWTPQSVLVAEIRI